MENVEIGNVNSRRVFLKKAAYAAPVITEITKAGKYYPAENYHQDYFLQNPDQGYCRYVIQPKLEKFRAAFADKLKK